jgi:spore protease
MQENMGIPVLAIGAPTVVGAASLVCETIEALTVMVQKEMSDDFLKVFSNHLDEAERYGVIKELLEKKAMPMYITPKDVDSIVQRLGYLIGEAVNRVHE